MNTQFKVKFLQQLANKKANKGFTLIELLVVVIIIGVLAAIALPNLLGQVAKGRQAEAKNNLGAINRAQQGYRLEKGTFGSLGDIPVQLQPEYYTYADGTGMVNNGAVTASTASAVGASYVAKAVATYENDINDYAAAVGQQTDGTFSSILCESQDPNSPVAVTPGAAAAAAACDATTAAGTTKVN